VLDSKIRGKNWEDGQQNCAFSYSISNKLSIHNKLTQAEINDLILTDNIEIESSLEWL